MLALKSLGAWSVASTPISAVGCRLSVRQYASGYQYQYCVNSASPTTAVRLGQDGTKEDWGLGNIGQ